ALGEGLDPGEVGDVAPGLVDPVDVGVAVDQDDGPAELDRALLQGGDDGGRGAPGERVVLLDDHHPGRPGRLGGVERGVEPGDVGGDRAARTPRAGDVEGGEIHAAAAPPGVLRYPRLAGDAHRLLPERLAAVVGDAAEGREAGGGAGAVRPLLLA